MDFCFFVTSTSAVFAIVAAARLLCIVHNGTQSFWQQGKARRANIVIKGSDQRENRGVWSNINTSYLVWRCGDGRSFFL
jgi:hypothetical protein